MAKVSGLNWTTAEIDDAGGVARDIKNDIGSLDISITRAVDEVTGLDSTSMERLLLLGDSSVTADGFTNFTANASHDVLSTVASNDVVRTLTLVVASQTFTGEYLITDYKTNRAADAKFRWASSLVLANGVDPTWS